MNHYEAFARLIDQSRELYAIRDNRNAQQDVRVRVFFSDVYSTRLIDPRGMWRLDVYSGNPTADMRLMFTHEQRRQLIEALGGIVPEWTQADEDAYIARKSGRDWNLALKPEDV